MTFKFNNSFFIVSLLLLLVETLIAVGLTGGFIRHTFGDFLAVILMYCGIKSFIKAQPLVIAIIVLLFAFFIEFLQLFNLLDYLNLREHHVITIILGSTFEVNDLIAYTLGTITIYLIDIKMITKT